MAGWWWHRPLISARRRQRQADLCELEVSLVYRVSSRTARATQRNPVSKKERQQMQLPLEILIESQ